MNEFEYEGTKTKYQVGKVVRVRPDEFNEDISSVCSSGIHYFKTIEPAIFYENIPINYTGHYMDWHNDGQKFSEGEYLDGEMTGRWHEWYENGQKDSEGIYLDGKQTGRWYEWYNNGKKWEEGEYLNGKEVGKWEVWYENGQKRSEGEYLNGTLTGRWPEWQRWYNSGRKKFRWDTD